MDQKVQGHCVARDEEPPSHASHLAPPSSTNVIHRDPRRFTPPPFGTLVPSFT